MIRISVDLPQPEGPISAAARPRAGERRAAMISTVSPLRRARVLRTTSTASGAGASGLTWRSNGWTMKLSTTSMIAVKGSA